jgi:T3SS negative regulator,GrlR
VVNGIYRVIFRSAQDQGKGILVCLDGLITGGDSGFVYNGTFESQNNQITATVRIQNDNPSSPSVFNPFLNDFQLDLVGQATELQFTLKGSVAGQRALGIIVEGKKLRNL